LRGAGLGSILDIAQGDAVAIGKWRPLYLTRDHGTIRLVSGAGIRAAVARAALIGQGPVPTCFDNQTAYQHWLKGNLQLYVLVRFLSLCLNECNRRKHTKPEFLQNKLIGTASGKIHLLSTGRGLFEGGVQ
jgi:hypothetical protein